MDLKELVSAQRRYWNSGATRSVGFRRDMLEKLERAVVSRERELLSALEPDDQSPICASTPTPTAMARKKASTI